MEFQILPRANRKCFLLFHYQTIDFQSCFTVSRHAFLIGCPITNDKLCTLYLPSKPDTNLSPASMVKLHEIKNVNIIFVWNAVEMSILMRLILSLQQEKMIDFDNCEEYLKSIKQNNIIYCSVKKSDICRLIRNQ